MDQVQQENEALEQRCDRLRQALAAAHSSHAEAEAKAYEAEERGREDMAKSTALEEELPEAESAREKA